MSNSGPRALGNTHGPTRRSPRSCQQLLYKLIYQLHLSFRENKNPRSCDSQTLPRAQSRMSEPHLGQIREVSDLHTCRASE